MYNGGAGCGAIAGFQRDLAATPRPSLRRDQATEIMNLSSHSQGQFRAEL